MLGSVCVGLTYVRTHAPAVYLHAHAVSADRAAAVAAAWAPDGRNCDLRNISATYILCVVLRLVRCYERNG